MKILLLALLIITASAAYADSGPCGMDTLIAKANLKYMKADTSQMPKNVKLYRNSIFGKVQAELEGRRFVSIVSKCYKTNVTIKKVLFKYEVIVDLSDK